MKKMSKYKEIEEISKKIENRNKTGIDYLYLSSYKKEIIEKIINNNYYK